MVPTYEQMGDWLEEIAGEFPESFFEELDGGIQLEEEALPDPDFPPGEMYILGEYCQDDLGRYICIGIFAMIAFQSILNIGMCLSMLPVIGVTLPFFSAGGPSAAALYLGIGVVLSVYMHSRRHLFMD